MDPRIRGLISKYYWVIIIIPFFIWAPFFYLKEKQELDQNKAYAYGIVTRSNSIYKQHSTRRYYYNFQINGHNYSGSTRGYNSQNIEVGNWYKVKFSSRNPENNRMNFDLEYYANLEIDSLGRVIDTIFSRKESFNKSDLDLRIKMIKSIIDSTSH